jgi:hypothetical protein
MWARDGGPHAAFTVPDSPAMQVWLDSIVPTTRRIW